MSVATDPANRAPSRRSLRRVAAAVAGTIAIVVVVVALGPPSDGLPLDPRSAEPGGLLGMVELLDDLGVDVEVTSRVPEDTSTRLFIPADQQPSGVRDEVLAFARAGGTVVVAEPSRALQDLAPRDASILGAIGRVPRAPECDALPEVDEVLQDRWGGFEVDEAGAVASCFPLGDGAAWLVAVSEGDGMLVALGSARPFTNDLLDEADNAVLAASLFGPSAGDRLVVLPRGPVGEGGSPLLELAPPGFLRALWLFGAAVVAAVLWRARRVGPPVEERLPPVLPSAELAHSVADLMQRAGDRQAAAARIREDVRREVRRVLRVPVGTPTARLVELLPTRASVDVADARLALLDGPVEQDRQLTELAAAASRVRAVLARPTPPPPADARSRPHASSDDRSTT